MELGCADRWNGLVKVRGTDLSGWVEAPPTFTRPFHLSSQPNSTYLHKPVPPIFTSTFHLSSQANSTHLHKPIPLFFTSQFHLSSQANSTFLHKPIPPMPTSPFHLSSQAISTVELACEDRWNGLVKIGGMGL